MRAIQTLSPERVLDHAVRGQYDAGMIDGKHVPAYRNEPNVRAADSAGRPRRVAPRVADRQLALGRRAVLPAHRQAHEQARHADRDSLPAPHHPCFSWKTRSWTKITPNELVIIIQPNEGISLSFEAKVPGPVVRLGAVDMDFNYSDYFGTEPSTGYETLLHDCMMGDPTLFQRADMVEAGWAVVQPILDVWKALPPRDFPNYAAGSCGPAQADELLRREGREWRDPNCAPSTRQSVAKRPASGQPVDTGNH